MKDKELREVLEKGKIIKNVDYLAVPFVMNGDIKGKLDRACEIITLLLEYLNLEYVPPENATAKLVKKPLETKKTK
uniref:Uncharacterized protein n=1 Tax=viral metagenome TaxID=1070528 RepID=A0A6M3JI52_9ZZZZ